MTPFQSNEVGSEEKAKIWWTMRHYCRSPPCLFRQFLETCHFLCKSRNRPEDAEWTPISIVTRADVSSFPLRKRLYCFYAVLHFGIYFPPVSQWHVDIKTEFGPCLYVSPVLAYLIGGLTAFHYNCLLFVFVNYHVSSIRVGNLSRSPLKCWTFNPIICS